MKASSFLNPVLRFEGYTHHISGVVCQTEIRVSVENGLLKLYVAASIDGEMKPIMWAGLGGQIITLHRVVQILQRVREWDSDGFSKMVLALMYYGEPFDTTKKERREQAVGKLRQLCSTFVIDPILKGVPEDLIDQIKKFDEYGLELETNQITLMIQKDRLTWDPEFAKFGIETVDQRKERLQREVLEEAASADEQQPHQLETAGAPA